MCLDNKKLLILDTDMATNPCMYSGTQKKSNIKKKIGKALIDKENISCHYFWSSSPFKCQSVLIFVYIFGLILQFEQVNRSSRS